MPRKRLLVAYVLLLFLCGRRLGHEDLDALLLLRVALLRGRLLDPMARSCAWSIARWASRSALIWARRSASFSSIVMGTGVSGLMVRPGAGCLASRRCNDTGRVKSLWLLGSISCSSVPLFPMSFMTWRRIASLMARFVVMRGNSRILVSGPGRGSVPSAVDCTLLLERVALRLGVRLVDGLHCGRAFRRPDAAILVRRPSRRRVLGLRLLSRNEGVGRPGLTSDDGRSLGRLALPVRHARRRGAHGVGCARRGRRTTDSAAL